MAAISGTFQRNNGQFPGLSVMHAAATASGLTAKETWSNTNSGSGGNCAAFFMQNWNAKRGKDALSAAPYFTDKHQLAIIADVRLDDRENLCAALDQPIPGGKFPSDCDLLLEAYAQWGSDCPKQLIGDYAFVIWDAKENTLFCARDHIGTKPLYYGFPDGNFAFSSDINMVLAGFEQVPSFNENFVGRKLVDWHYSTMDQTAYEGIKKLPPAHSLSITADGADLQCYWKPEDIPPLILANDEEYAKALFDLVETAVIDRLRTAEDDQGTQPKFGVHVTGGLDSSAIAAIANDCFRERGEAIPAAFSWQPPPDPDEPLSPEHSWIEAMVEDQQLDIQYIVPNADDIYAMFRRDGTREPVGGTLLNEEAIQKVAAKQDIRIILSGWGGDEFISHNGRAYYPELLRNGQWRKLISEMRDFDQNLLKSIITKAALPAYWPSFGTIWRRWRKRKKINKKPPGKSFIHGDFQKRIKASKRQLTNSMSTRETQLELLANGHVTERMELWAANARPLGMEYRYPLLDRRVMEFAFAVPIDQFKRGRWKRWIFRNAMKDILPDTVLWNLSKLELIRTDVMSEQVAQAFGRVGDDLRSGKIKTTRGQYVDMPRLIDHLDAEKYRETGKLGPTRTAVEFLDFQ